MNLKLYHGTSTDRLDNILKNGLLPRGRGRAGNWKGESLSRSGFTYLATTYPAYYAFVAWCNVNKKKPDALPVILQIDTSGLELYPDEDFLALMASHQEGGKPDDWRQKIDMESNKGLALASVEHFGSCAVKHVPPSAIKAHRVLKHPTVDTMELCFALGADQSVHPTTKQLVGYKYLHRVDLLFQEGIDVLLDTLHKNPHFPDTFVTPEQLGELMEMTKQNRKS